MSAQVDVETLIAQASVLSPEDQLRLVRVLIERVRQNYPSGTLATATPTPGSRKVAAGF
jgi:hypothetical protein